MADKFPILILYALAQSTLGFVDYLRGGLGQWARYSFTPSAT